MYRSLPFALNVVNGLQRQSVGFKETGRARGQNIVLQCCLCKDAFETCGEILNYYFFFKNVNIS